MWLYVHQNITYCRQSWHFSNKNASLRRVVHCPSVPLIIKIKFNYLIFNYLLCPFTYDFHNVRIVVHHFWHIGGLASRINVTKSS